MCLSTYLYSAMTMALLKEHERVDEQVEAFTGCRWMG